MASHSRSRIEKTWTTRLRNWMGQSRQSAFDVRMRGFRDRADLGEMIALTCPRTCRPGWVWRSMAWRFVAFHPCRRVRHCPQGFGRVSRRRARPRASLRPGRLTERRILLSRRTQLFGGSASLNSFFGSGDCHRAENVRCMCRFSHS